MEVGTQLSDSYGFWCSLVGTFAVVAVREIDQMNALQDDSDREEQARRFALNVKMLSDSVRCARDFDAYEAAKGGEVLHDT